MGKELLKPAVKRIKCLRRLVERIGQNQRSGLMLFEGKLAILLIIAAPVLGVDQDLECRGRGGGRWGGISEGIEAEGGNARGRLEIERDATAFCPNL